MSQRNKEREKGRERERHQALAELVEETLHRSVHVTASGLEGRYVGLPVDEAHILQLLQLLPVHLLRICAACACVSGR